MYHRKFRRVLVDVIFEADETAGTAGDEIVDADIDRVMKPRWYSGRGTQR